MLRIAVENCGRVCAYTHILPDENNIQLRYPIRSANTVKTLLLPPLKEQYMFMCGCLCVLYYIIYETSRRKKERKNKTND